MKSVNQREAMAGYCLALFDSPIGCCGVAWGARGIVGVQLPMAGRDKTLLRLRQRYDGIAEAAPPPDVRHAIDEMTELLAGKPIDLADIALDLTGVPEFHCRVYAEARTIAPGRR